MPVNAAELRVKAVMLRVEFACRDTPSFESILLIQSTYAGTV